MVDTVGVFLSPPGRGIRRPSEAKLNCWSQLGEGENYPQPLGFPVVRYRSLPLIRPLRGHLLPQEGEEKPDRHFNQHIHPPKGT